MCVLGPFLIKLYCELLNAQQWYWLLNIFIVAQSSQIKPLMDSDFLPVIIALKAWNAFRLQGSGLKYCNN